MIFWQYMLPQHWASKLIFKLTRIENTWLKNLSIRWFIKTYQVDLSLAVHENIQKYQNFNDFFTRTLKPGIRPIADSAIICPVDGTVSQLGKIDNAQIIQAKNHHYRVDKLLANNAKNAMFETGIFATIYLSPQDYHRIHMPYDGKLVEMDYIPGNLFSVSPKNTQNIDNLFAKNERVVCYFESEFGLCAIVLVGAIFVGSIQTVWQGQITPPYQKKVRHFDYSKQAIFLKKGEELGRFNMGSTVIMLIPRNNKIFNLSKSQVVEMGQALV